MIVGYNLYKMSTSEVEGFNSTFTSYEGIQKGSQVKNLMYRLIANANTYMEEPKKIPCISYNSSISTNNSEDESYLFDKYAYGVIEESKIEVYVEFIKKIAKTIDLKHEYNVVFSYGTDNYGSENILSGITINYDEYSEESNFIFTGEKLSEYNGLVGIPELVDGEIKNHD